MRRERRVRSQLVEAAQVKAAQISYIRSLRPHSIRPDTPAAKACGSQRVEAAQILYRLYVAQPRFENEELLVQTEGGPGLCDCMSLNRTACLEVAGGDERSVLQVYSQPAVGIGSENVVRVLAAGNEVERFYGFGAVQVSAEVRRPKTIKQIDSRGREVCYEPHKRNPCSSLTWRIRALEIELLLESMAGRARDDMNPDVSLCATGCNRARLVMPFGHNHGRHCSDMP